MTVALERGIGDLLAEFAAGTDVVGNLLDATRTVSAPRLKSLSDLGDEGRVFVQAHILWQVAVFHGVYYTISPPSYSPTFAKTTVGKPFFSFRHCPVPANML